MEGLTLDTGALVALERRRSRMARVWRAALARGLRITVPSPVVAEWWRARTDFAEDLLAAVVVEPVSVAVARRAGEALGRLPRGTRISAVDAIVVASAALRGDVVYTADLDDLMVVRDTSFPAVRVLVA